MTDQPFAIPAALFFLVAIPLVLGVIPRNRLYGVRTQKTLSKDRIWYAVNRLAGIALIASSGVYGVVATLWPYDRQASDNFATWGLHLIAFIAPLLCSLGLATRYAKQL